MFVFARICTVAAFSANCIVYQHSPICLNSLYVFVYSYLASVSLPDLLPTAVEVLGRGEVGRRKDAELRGLPS